MQVASLLRGGAVFLLVLASASVHAATCTSKANGNWNASGSWNCGSVPTSADDVVINNNVITLNANSAANTVTINNGGTLRHTSNNSYSLTIVGALTVNATVSSSGAGTFTLNAASVANNGTAASLAADVVNVSGNLVSSGTLTVGALNTSGDVTNTGDFAVTNLVFQKAGAQSATFDNGTSTVTDLTVNSGSNVSSSAYSRLYLKGDLINNGGFSLPNTSLIANGTVAQSIDGTNAVTLGDLTINNGSGLTLTQDLTITDVLTLTNGVISASGSTVILGKSCDQAAISGGSRTSHVVGKVRLNFPSYPVTCIFPVGSSGRYAPITFSTPWSPSTLGGSVTGSTTSGDHPDTNSGLSGISAPKSVNRYWTLTPEPSATFFAYDATFQFCNAAGCGGSDLDGAATPANFVVKGRTGSTWTGLASTAPTTTTRKVAGLSKFGDFVIGEAGYCLVDSFASGLNPALWNVAGSGGFTPEVVTSPTVPSSRLRLTDNQTYRATFAQLKKWFPAANNRIEVEFDYYGWGGSGADGIAMVLSDAGVPPNPGGYGGSLGYANRSGVDGFNGGWLGIGLDEFGNYPNSTEGRRGYPAGYTPPTGANTVAGAYPNSIAVRGSGTAQSSGYALLANKGTVTPALTTTNATPHRYRIVVDHTNSVNAYVSVARNTGGGFVTIIPAFDVKGAKSGQSTIPTNMLLSFTGSTGASTNNHEIGNVSVCATSMNNVGNSTPAANFECLETSTLATWSTTARKPLYTKLVGRGFKFDIVALKTDGTIENGFIAAGGDSKTVTVDLFDDSASPSPACSTYTSPVATQTVTYASGDGGRKTIASDFNLSQAWGKLRCRVTDASAAPPVYGCSSDTFAVRPQSINSILSDANADGTGTNAGAAKTVKAGTSFSLTAGTGTSGYGGIPKIDGARIAWASMPSGGALGTLAGTFTTAASPTDGNGATGSAFTYSEVGYFQFLTQGVYDDTYTALSSDATNGDCTDDSSNSLVGGKYGCKFGNTSESSHFGRFIPDHFVVTPSTTAPACSNVFSYFGQDGFTTPFALTAQNSANGTTKNYSGDYAKLNLTQYASYGFSASPLPTGSELSRSSSTTEPKGNWANGVASNVTAKHQISRPSALTAETAITVSAAPTDGEVPAGAATAVGAATKFRYGRLWLGNAYGSESRALSLPYETQYWNGFSFVRNTLDNCTALTSANVGLGNYQGSVSAAKLPTTPTSAISLGAFASGSGSLSLAAPNVSGSADVAIRLGPALSMCPTSWTPTYPAGTPTSADYLRAQWCGNSSDKDPVARATFGIATKNRQIYLRENY